MSGANDALAEAEVVERIVKHLGVALHNPSSATVSCAADDELDRRGDQLVPQQASASAISARRGPRSNGSPRPCRATARPTG